MSNKLSGLLEYFGVRSRDYYHSRPEVAYNPDDPFAYYLDQRQRADYDGPFDENGLPLYPSGPDRLLLPVHLIAWGLGHLALFRDNGRLEHQTNFKKTADWLIENQGYDGCWLSPLAMPRYGLTEPWRSAMVQGLALSALTRAALLFADARETYLDAAARALLSFQAEIREGGVASYHAEGPFYEEYPCDPPRHVLNGFIFALWGLYDMVRVAEHPRAHLMWDNGLATLRVWLPRYDLGHWSLYQLPPQPRNPATVPYHELHVKQLEVMAAITSDDLFTEWHERWRGYLDNPLNRLRTLPSKVSWLLSGR